MYFFAEVDKFGKVISVIKSPTYLSSKTLIEITEPIDIINTKGEVYTYDATTGLIQGSTCVDSLKKAKWAEIKLRRDQLEFGGFEFEGGIYDSDQVSQSRILVAAASGLDQVWTLADNSTKLLKGSELQMLHAALQNHIASIHERGRIARLAIEAAQTKEDIEKIHL